MEIKGEYSKFFKKSVLLIVLSSVLSSLFVLILGRPGCGDSNAFTICLSLSLSLLVYVIPGSLISVIALGSRRLISKKMDNRTSLIAALFIGVIMFTGVIYGLQLNEKSSNPHRTEMSACKIVILQKCEDATTISVPNRCTIDGEIQSSWMPSETKIEEDQLICPAE